MRVRRGVRCEAVAALSIPGSGKERDDSVAATTASGRAEGVLEALDREQERAAEPWLTPASLRVLAADNLALLAEIERLRREQQELLTELRNWRGDDA